jgi:hypothetical protein
MKNYRTIFSAFFILFILFSLGGCISYYIGYYGYDKNLVRRHSLSKFESTSRKVFIKDLKYKIDIPVIKNVYIERAYRWGSSYKVTKILTKADTLSKYIKNEPDKPYQIIVEHIENYDKQLIYVTKFRIHLKDSSLYDTTNIEVYVRDSIDNRLKGIHILKIWE